MIGSFPAILNFNRLFLKLNRFICNYLPILPDHILHLPRGRQCEALIALPGNVVALLAIRDESSEVRQDEARLVRDVGPEVPRIGSREESRVPHGFRMGDPLVLCLRRGLDLLGSVAPDVRDALRHPLHVLLDRRHHVGEHRGAQRPRDREEVREAGDREPKERPRPELPFALQHHAGFASDVDAGKGAGDGVEPGRKNDRVHLKLLPIGGGQS